jgi:hypothetical protein
MGQDLLHTVHPAADARSGLALTDSLTHPAVCALIGGTSGKRKAIARVHANLASVLIGKGDGIGVLGIDKMVEHSKISFHSPGSLSLWLYLIIPQNRAFVKGFLKNFFNFFVHNLFTKSLQFREPDK